jgi:uncharacterized protein YggU (UPF0235/DUF167 family)
VSGAGSGGGSGSGTTLTVRLTPRGGRDAIDGPGRDGELRIRVAAPPVDGAANQAMMRLLADMLGVPGSSIRISGGGTARTKRVTIVGVDTADLVARWPGLRIGPR